MNLLVRNKCVWALCVVGIASAAALGQPRIFITLQGDDPTGTTPGENVKITAKPGETFTFDVWLEDLGDGFVAVNAYQLTLPCTTSSGCVGSVDNVGSLIDIDKARPDWIFFGLDNLVVPSGDCTISDDPRTAAVLFGFPADPPVVVTDPVYLAEVQYTVSDPAIGEFKLRLVCVPSDGCKPVDETYLRDIANVEILPIFEDGVTFNVGDVQAPEIVHEDSPDADTVPCSGYIDPRLEVDPSPPNDLAGLEEATIRFNMEVFDADGNDIDASDFSLTEHCGGGAPPNITSAAYVGGDKSLVLVEWDRPITLQEWTILQAHVFSASCAAITDNGNLADTNEPDRIDMSALPGDIDQSEQTQILDLLRFRQFVTNACGAACPDCGGEALYFDTDRNGMTGQVLDFLRFRQILLGSPPATQEWLLVETLCDRP